MPTKANSKNKLVLLNHDLMFKYIFGTVENKRFTIDLLKSVLDLEVSIKDINIINSVVLNQKNVKERKFELDIFLMLDNKTCINSEMQNNNDKNSEIKNTLYVMQKFKDSLKKGKKYTSIKKTKQVVFIKDDNLHKQNKDIIKEYAIINKKDNKDTILDGLFEIIYVDVDANDNISYNKINKRLKLWLDLIRAESDKDIYEIAKKDKMIKEAVKKMEMFSNKKYVQDYEGRDRLFKSRLEDAKIEGIDLGKQQGFYEIAKNMLKRNMSIADVSEITNLPIEEIKKLQV